MEDEIPIPITVMIPMRIGLDLDGTVYAFPCFFGQLIQLLSGAGHKFFCVSNHPRSDWETDRHKLAGLGVNPDLIDPSLMCTDIEWLHRHGAENKAKMADRCDICFDDDAPKFQHLTRTPVFTVPREKGRPNPR